MGKRPTETRGLAGCISAFPFTMLGPSHTEKPQQYLSCRAEPLPEVSTGAVWEGVPLSVHERGGV